MHPSRWQENIVNTEDAAHSQELQYDTVIRADAKEEIIVSRSGVII